MNGQRTAEDVTILVVEDDVVSRKLLRSILEKRGYQVVTAGDGEEALAMIREDRPDMIVSDWGMPRMDGTELCQIIRSDDSLFDLYFIMFTARHELEDKIDALGMGADDFITKPIDHRELVARVATGLRIVELQDKLKQANGRLEILALKDGLTGLYNRRAILEIGAREFSRCTRYGEPMTFLMLDLDHFKRFNDTYGHQFGDEVLRVTADALSDSERKSDYIGRYGGEEFCIILTNTKIDDGLLKAEKIRTLISELVLEPPTSNDRPQLTMSIGACDVRPCHKSIEMLVGDADKALYAAKESGRNCCVAAPVSE